MELVKRDYWWPGIKGDIKKYVQGCFKCQQNKVQHQSKYGELHPLESESNRKNTIVVIVDRFMKMIRLKAMTTNILSEEIAKIYRNKI